ncbi:15470_t:CDS:2 [Funneliformis mosseae]|uniref:15470_t:CDS:1 n=1 Tax=Funneliformis mosseae TaxID=27381 RepID=A0A9N8ZMH1_FUNMO|nr:15470_t:CDS:2 [Funneliformis mosseae]
MRKNGGATEITKLLTKKAVNYKEFEKKCERANTSKFWECRDRTVIIIELPKRDHEVTHTEFAGQFYLLFLIYNFKIKLPILDPQSDASFVPNLLPNPAQIHGNPWPTVIVEVVNSQSLESIIQKTTQFWLAPNRVEVVLNAINSVVELALKIPMGITYQTIDAENRLYNGCSAPEMRTLSISPHCIYIGCPRQHPPLSPYPISNDVIIDLFHIQQQTFRVIKRFTN